MSAEDVAEEMGPLGLVIGAIFERLNRIEDALGITEPTPMQVRLDAEMDDEEQP